MLSITVLYSLVDRYVNLDFCLDINIVVSLHYRDFIIFTSNLINITHNIDVVN